MSRLYCFSASERSNVTGNSFVFCNLNMESKPVKNAIVSLIWERVSVIPNISASSLANCAVILDNSEDLFLPKLTLLSNSDLDSFVSFKICFYFLNYFLVVANYNKPVQFLETFFLHRILVLNV